MLKTRVVVLSAMLLMLVFSMPVRAELPGQPHIINNLPQCIEITKFSFQPVYSQYSTKLKTDVSFRNTGNQAIEAYRFGFVYYNYFDEKTYSFGGYGLNRVKPQGSYNASWESLSGTDALTGFVWIDSLRLADGTVIKADTSEVARIISETIKEPISAEALSTVRDNEK